MKQQQKSSAFLSPSKPATSPSPSHQQATSQVMSRGDSELPQELANKEAVAEDGKGRKRGGGSEVTSLCSSDLVVSGEEKKMVLHTRGSWLAYVPFVGRLYSSSNQEQTTAATTTQSYEFVL